MLAKTPNLCIEALIALPSEYDYWKNVRVDTDFTIAYILRISFG